MPNLSNALQIGLSGLKASQMGLNVAGQNIANVNTEGYTRQRPIFEASKPISFPAGVFGTGVNLLEIARFRDAFIDRQYRDQNQVLGDMEKQSQSMDMIEGIINEPSDTGLHNEIENFFNSLQDLATNPESSSVRTTVREQGRALARMFNQTWNHLDQIRDNKNLEIIDKVAEANGILDRIASLNPQIATTEALGNKANDLRDSRDLLLDKLSKIVDMSAYEDPVNGSVTVSIGGQNFVVLDQVQHLMTESVNQNGKEVIQIINPVEKSEIKLSGGEIHGILEVRDTLIPKIEKEVDTLASAIITEVNKIHRNGFGLQGGRTSPPTGIDFFEGTDSRTMKLSNQVESDPSNIAASKNGAPGDNVNALEMAQLRNSEVLNNNTFTFEDYLGGIISSFGLESVGIQESLANQEKLVEHFKNFRESQIGVNMDEELMNLVTFQKAFGANARVLSTVNQMFDVVIALGTF